ncbi:MAG: hypothetical protein ABR990_00080 [Terracidiphilus sp.]
MNTASFPEDKIAENLLKSDTLDCLKSTIATTTTISVFTRHQPECPKRDDPTWKRCKCCKSLYIYEGGKVRYVSARTRSWEQAERVARAESDKRDPVKQELARIEAKKAAKDCSLSDALDQWISGIKAKGPTHDSYLAIKRGMFKWADSNNIVTLSDVTPDALDRWVSSWKDASNTQGFRLSRVRAFFRWAHGLHKIEENPAQMLRSIKREQEEETQPLTAKQFDELIAATYKYDVDRRADFAEDGAQHAGLFSQFHQDVPIVLIQVVAVEPFNTLPVERAGNEDGSLREELLPFVGHLQEEQEVSCSM